MQLIKIIFFLKKKDENKEKSLVMDHLEKLFWVLIKILDN